MRSRRHGCGTIERGCRRDRSWYSSDMWIKCPECGTELEVPDNHPVRPFCSKRCKLLDLGHWFNEEHRIPIQSSEPASSEANSDDRGAPGQTGRYEAAPSLTVDLNRFKIPDA